MKRVSYWALRHAIAARIAIVACYVLINLTGWLGGIVLTASDIVLSPVFFYGSVLALLVTLTTFQLGKSGIRKSYLWRKTVHLICIAITFLLTVYSSNSYDRGLPVNPLYTACGAVIIHQGAAANADRVKKHASAIKRDQRKQLRLLIKNFKKRYRDRSQGEKILLIVLLSIGALFLISLVAALACSIICSGAEALGYIVLVLGIAGIIFVFVRLVRGITHGYQHKKKPLMPDQA